MTGPIGCLDAIVWFEPGTDPAEPLDEVNHNVTRPAGGEERAVGIRHHDQVPIGERLWLLFQSGLSLANGFPEPEEELENAALIEVEILSQDKLPKKRDSYGRVQYNAQVRCLQIIDLKEIASLLEPCEPQHWPEENREVQIWETSSFTFVWIISQEITEWFALTRTEPPCLILERSTFRDEPFTICNCEWNWSKWPHRVHKERR